MDSECRSMYHLYLMYYVSVGEEGTTLPGRGSTCSRKRKKEKGPMKEAWYCVSAF